jgi:hypothetical protein
MRGIALSSRRIKTQNNNKEKTVKKTLLLTAAPLLVVAFYKAPEVTAQSCATMEIPPVCQDGNRITINNDSKNVIGRSGRERRFP